MITSTSALQLAAQTLFVTQKPRLKAREIAEYAVQPDNMASWRTLGIELESADPIDLSARIAQLLGHYVKRVPESRRVISGNKNGWSLGPMAPKVISANGPEFSHTESSQHTGLAGEFAVISELLFSGWNATKLPVDDGVDVVATLGHELRTIQVKTAQSSHFNPERFSFQVDIGAHKRYSNLRHYYVFVMRRMLPTRWSNDLLLLTSGELESLEARGALGGSAGGKWSLCVEVKDGCYSTRSGIPLSNNVNSFRTCFK